MYQFKSLIDSVGDALLNVVKTRKGTEFRTIQDVLFKTQADLEKLAANKGDITGIPTGYYELDKLRNELGLSQQKMADESGVVREMIAVIENRKKHPQINTLIKILEPFGYTLSITKIKEEER